MSTDFGPGMMGDPVPCGKCCRMGCSGESCGPSHTTRYNEFQLMSFDELLSECLRLDARIAELERCVVMGGDGKPIGIDSTVYVPFLNGPCVVESISRACVAFSNQYEAARPEYCYSSPDSVPEGDKE